MSLNVYLDPTRNFSVKTTPAMTLKAVLDAACARFKLNPDDYALKYRRRRS
jgi:hypothetical protein